MLPVHENFNNDRSCLLLLRFERLEVAYSYVSCRVIKWTYTSLCQASADPAVTRF